MMTDWLTEDGPARRPFLSPFAKKSSGSSKVVEEDDDDEDDEDDDEDEDDDDDPDADLTDEELRQALKDTRDKLSRASRSASRRRKQLREERTAKREAAPKSKAEDDGKGGEKIDLEAEREAARREGAAPGILRAKKAEAKSALIAAGVPLERVNRAIGMLDLDDLELDDDGLDGIEEAIDELKEDVPEFFATKRKRRQSVAGGGSGDETPRTKKMSASERQAAQLTGGVRR